MTYFTLDSGVVGNGVADAEPADTFLQNRIAENVKAVAVGHDAFAVSHANNNAALNANLGDRPWASLHFISVLLADLPDWKGLTGVKISMLLNCQSADPVTPGIGGRFRFRLDGKTQEEAVPTTYNAGPNYRIREYQIDLLEPLLGQGQSSIPFEVWFESTQGGSDDGLSNYQTVTFDGTAIRNSAGYFTELSVLGPVAASFETRFIKTNLGSGSTYDVIGAGVVDGQDAIYVLPTPPAHSQAQWFFLSYLQVRAIRIKPIFADDAAGQMPAAAYSPNKIFGSTEAQRAANAIKRLESRPRVLSVGPRGRFGSSEINWAPRLYPTRFEYVMGDDVSTELLKDVAFLRTENPNIRISFRYTSVNLNQNSAAEEGSSTWTLYLAAKYSDGTSIGTTSIDVDATLHPAHMAATKPLLMSLQFAANGASPPDFAHKEGSIFEVDAPLIQTAVFDFDTLGHDTITRMSEPVEISASLVLNSVTKYCSADNNASAFVQFVLVGYTIVEVPK